MKYIVLIIIGLVGLMICRIVENIMWDQDRDNSLDIHIEDIRNHKK